MRSRPAIVGAARSMLRKSDTVLAIAFGPLRVATFERDDTQFGVDAGLLAVRGETRVRRSVSVRGLKQRS